MSATPAKQDFPILWKRTHPYLNASSAKVIAAVAFVVIGGAVIINLPEAPASSSASANSSGTSNASAADLSAQTPVAAGDSRCDKQAWPYIDQRCADAAQSPRGTREVRVVTDRGTFSTAITPIPIVQPKPPAPSPQPVVAKADTPIGPRVIPSVSEAQQTMAAAAENSVPAPRVEPMVAKPAPAPQQPQSMIEPVVAKREPAPQPLPQDMQAVVTVRPARPQMQEQPVAALNKPVPAAPTTAASMPPPEPDMATNAQAKAEKRTAKLVKSLEKRGVPPEVLAAVHAAVASERGMSVQIQGGTVQIFPRRARSREAVPEEVLAAVEAAAARERRFSGGRRVVMSGGDGELVTIGSPGRGERMYLVPREGFAREW